MRLTSGTALAACMRQLASHGYVRLVVAGCLAGLVANCSAGSNIDRKYGVAPSPRVVSEDQTAPKGGGRRQVGKPYTIAGRTFVPREDPNYSREGIASWYGRDFHGRLTANGEVFDRHALSAAHPTLPLPSYVRVTNLENGRSVTVRVNDRGPFHGNRLIDVSRKTAELLGFDRKGTARVHVAYEGPASTEGSDDRRLLATYREHGRAAQPPSTFALGPTAPIAAPTAVAFRQPTAPQARTMTAHAPVAPAPVQTAALAPSQPVAAPSAVPVPAPVPLRQAYTPSQHSVQVAFNGGATTPAAAPVAVTASQRVSDTWSAFSAPATLVHPQVTSASLY